MRSYNQFCPVAKAAEVFCERWTALIIRELAAGGARFSDIQRGVPLASPSLLSGRLRQLVSEGIIERQKDGDTGRQTYALTAAGAEFVPVVMALGVWGQRWSRRDLAENEMDLGLLLWALEKGARPEAFSRRRTIVELDIYDQPEQKRHWWYLNEDSRCELCLTAPDRESDVYVRAGLADLIRLWRGDIALSRALADDRLEVHGTTTMIRAFRRWFGTAAVAHVQPATADVPA